VLLAGRVRFRRQLDVVAGARNLDDARGRSHARTHDNGAAQDQVGWIA
jgi:hypothetical protein